MHTSQSKKLGPVQIRTSHPQDRQRSIIIHEHSFSHRFLRDSSHLIKISILAGPYKFFAHIGGAKVRIIFPRSRYLSSRSLSHSLSPIEPRGNNTHKSFRQVKGQITGSYNNIRVQEGCLLFLQLASVAGFESGWRDFKIMDDRFMVRTAR